MQLIDIANDTNNLRKSMQDLEKEVNDMCKISEEEQLEILEQLRMTDFEDTEEYDDIEHESGHWDEQAFYNYTYAADEDGNWLHPYDKEY